LLLAGSSSISWVPPVIAETFLPQALFGSIPSPARCAHWVPAMK